ncbi:class I SAM-dependent DNA methyltransferase [Alkalicoccus luteus]|uniref:Class I SAM-dependent methyltransferase n=1 Tax=Alkalicoccus luteus TaxID=1237094 RepID=A0A969PLQ6_9BACI|nr:class I SAM-dependent methyltransferase [Alkalicoccus luteus]NJP36515.1 class I SAM-dependent methyltransferase [Alkalicoccus luteus]
MSDTHFAGLYDMLMEDAPYEDWMTYAVRRLKRGGDVLDLACGTGTFTLMLAEAGYHVSGADISEEMLAAAERKVRQEGNNTSFFKQDMRTLNGFSNLDAVTLFCDGLNYLPHEQDVKRTFASVHSALKQDGVFLFDVHTPYKMEHVFDNQLYGENSEAISYLWFCEPADEPLSVTHLLTFFVRTGTGLYERMDEELYQRTYAPEVYKQWLEEAGFAQVNLSAEFGSRPLAESDDRCFIAAVKK